MRADKLRETVEAAIAVDQQIQELSGELKRLKDALVQEAKSRPDELGPSEKGDGTTIVFRGIDGHAARVSFPRPSLKATIKGEGKAIEKIRLIAGPAFHRLFDQQPSYKPTAGDFRGLAKDILGKDAKKLISLCETVSSPRVQFETKELAG